MKTFFTVLLIIILIIVGFTLFNNDDTDQEAEPQVPPEQVALEDGTYTIEDESTLEWQGHKPLVDNYFDSGTVTISEGTLSVTDAAASGTFTIDMTTITGKETSNPDRGVDMLSSHLKSDAFFDVENHPTATFAVTSLAEEVGHAGNYTATGDLTIKGITHEISFPVTIAYQDEMTLTVSGSTTLDRSRWDIRFGSASFFNDLADSVISDDMDITFNIILTKV